MTNTVMYSQNTYLQPKMKKIKKAFQGKSEFEFLFFFFFFFTFKRSLYLYFYLLYQ